MERPTWSHWGRREAGADSKVSPPPALLNPDWSIQISGSQMLLIVYKCSRRCPIRLKLINNSWGQLPTTRCMPHHVHVFGYPMKNSIPLSSESGIYHWNMPNDNLYKSCTEVTLLLQCVSFCFQSHTYSRCFLHFCIQNTPKCHKPKKAKEKKVVLKTTIHTSSLREPNFIPKKCNLPFGRTCPKGSMQHFHLHQKSGASVRK